MDNYTLVLFPEVQEYMEEEWFTKEAILYQTINEEQDYESSAYFIPTKYITSVEEKMYSREKMLDLMDEYQEYLINTNEVVLTMRDWIKENL